MNEKILRKNLNLLKCYYPLLWKQISLRYSCIKEAEEEFIQAIINLKKLEKNLTQDDPYTLEP